MLNFLYGDFKMKCLFLYNPKSGKEKIKKNLDYIVNRLKEKFEVVDVHPSKSKEDFIEKAKDSCGTYDYLVFSIKSSFDLDGWTSTTSNFSFNLLTI